MIYFLMSSASVGSWPVFCLFFSQLVDKHYKCVISMTCIQGSTAWWRVWRSFGQFDGFVIGPIMPPLRVVMKGYHLHVICLANLNVWLVLTHSSAKRCARELSLVFCSVCSMYIDRHVSVNTWALIKLSFMTWQACSLSTACMQRDKYIQKYVKIPVLACILERSRLPLKWSSIA